MSNVPNNSSQNTTLGLLKQILELQTKIGNANYSTELEKLITQVNSEMTKKGNNNKTLPNTNNNTEPEKNKNELSEFLEKHDFEILCIIKELAKGKTKNSPKNYRFAQYKKKVKRKKDKKKEKNKNYHFWYKKYKNIEELKKKLQCNKKKTLSNRVKNSMNRTKKSMNYLMSPLRRRFGTKKARASQAVEVELLPSNNQVSTNATVPVSSNVVDVEVLPSSNESGAVTNVPVAVAVAEPSNIVEAEVVSSPLTGKNY
uniref:Uncharacterized protein n=1 Tax=Florenciella sp. virus SA2 TaxID=3240092 RepID=A0AB39J8X8_9VIRU